MAETGNLYVAPNGAKYSSKESYHDQVTRSIFVLVVGPLFILGGILSKSTPIQFRIILIGLGIFTSGYFAKKYIETTK